MTPVAGLVPSLVGLLATAALVGTPVFSFTDDKIDESSGLVDLGTTMVTTNDSGDDAVVYLIDKVGRTIGQTTYADEVQDVEALAPFEQSARGPGSTVWVADIGDNRERRTSVQVYRVAVSPGDRTVSAPRFDLVYPDGPHDAETIVVGPDGRLRIVTKGIVGGTVYVAPKVLDPDRSNRLQRGPAVDLFATDGAVFPDGRHVLVRGYGTALIARFPSFTPVAFLTLPAQEQGEGVSIGSSGRIRLSSEGANSEVLQIALPGEVKAQLQKRTSTGSAPMRIEDPEGTGDPARRDQGRDWAWLLGGTAAVCFLGWLVLGRRR